MEILGYNGKTPAQLKKIFHCEHCGCDFVANYNDILNNLKQKTEPN